MIVEWTREPLVQSSIDICILCADSRIWSRRDRWRTTENSKSKPQSASGSGCKVTLPGQPKKTTTRRQINRCFNLPTFTLYSLYTLTRAYIRHNNHHHHSLFRYLPDTRTSNISQRRMWPEKELGKYPGSWWQNTKSIKLHHTSKYIHQLTRIEKSVAICCLWPNTNSYLSPHQRTERTIEKTNMPDSVLTIVPSFLEVSLWILHGQHDDNKTVCTIRTEGIGVADVWAKRTKYKHSRNEWDCLCVAVVRSIYNSVFSSLFWTARGEFGDV